ncbi:MAG: hypothetical protein CVT80_06855 [Alphaproteobacteria bacterium HGW-Alphaproteobacteria-2]|nr:MAG: hypothetical protein CVT80_06855 [Alphaproteobacteria bacterium HGW-Alphaproteobacteria-2]
MTRIIPEPDLERLSPDVLRKMLAAGDEINECYRVLRKGGLNVVGEVLKGNGQFVELNHYPPGDVYDRDSHAQYYYHAHREDEHGHFHTFLRAKGMPLGAQPVPEAATKDWPKGSDALAHLVAISMEKKGYPIRLFTTNRWVTGETWYPAREIKRMLGLFAIDHAYPSWPTNRWITAMIRLFRPQIEALVDARDVEMRAHALAEPEVDLYEDRNFEVISEIEIDVDRQLERVAAALAAAEATA